MHRNSPVFLVNISRRTNQIQFPIGLSVLVNALKFQGIQINVIDLIPIPIEEREKFLLDVIPDKPAIYGFSIVVGNYNLDEVERFAALIRKKSPKSIIVYGGSLPSAIPELMLERCCCDYIVHGEGERTFAVLIQAIWNGEYAPQEMPGVYFKDKGRIVGKPSNRLIKLDNLSNPDFSLFDMEYYIKYLRETGQSWELMASRGCRGNCSFCYKFLGNGFSRRNVEYVLDEIEYVIKRFDLRRFYFVDENFLDSKEYFFEFIEKKKKRGLDLTFIVQSRLDCVDREICKVGSDNGLIGITAGIESVSQDTLDRINKKISIGEVEKKITLMREYNIRPSLGFIVGFPWDKEEDYLNMVAFIERNNLCNHGKVSYLTPLPATRILQEAVRKGMIKDEYEYIRNLDNLYWQRNINLTNFDDRTLDYYYGRIYNLLMRDPPKVKSEEYIKKIRKLY